MNSVERVKEICKERKIPISRLEKDLGFANGYISQLRKGSFPDDRLLLISNYLGVTPNYLTTGVEREETKKEPDAGSVELNPDYFKLSAENKALVDALIAQLSRTQSES